MGIMNQKHLLSVFQFSKQHVLQYIKRAIEIKRDGPSHMFPSKTVISMFYEPSTRTSCSFQAAAIRLGCRTIAITDKISSSEKGESLEDTIKTLQYYGDAIVLRHPAKGSSRKAADVSAIPIINAGDGNGEHPTQALLDIFTIYEELKKRNIDLMDGNREPITVAMVGDLKNSRTVHSLVHLLAMFPKIRIIYIAPPSLEIPEEIMCQVSNTNDEVHQIQGLSLFEAIGHMDILYMTRIQKERFENVRDYYAITLSHGFINYCITPELLERAKSSAMFMHPLPRSTELPACVDADPRAVYFNQVENGVYMRMAILEGVFLEA
jgi:aspartate carbamoyltransferase